MNLYKLSSNFRNLQELVENEEVELDVVAEGLKQIEADIESKVENIAKLMKNLESNITAFKEEEKRLATRRKTMENKVDWLKDWLMVSLNTTKKDKIQAGTFTVRKQKNPQGVRIVNQDKIPKEFIVEQEPRVNKKELAKRLKNKEKIDGAELAPESYHIRIQ